MKESTVETAAIREAKAAGWLVRKVAWPGRRGAPDRLFVKPYPKRFVLIELKRPGKEARFSQLMEMKELRAAGFEVYECDNITAVRTCLGLPTPKA